MKKTFFIVLTVIVGCATGGVQEGQLKETQAQVTEMNKSISRLDRRVEELNNDLFILNDKVKDNYQSLEELRALVLQLKQDGVASDKKKAGSAPVSRKAAPLGPDEFYRRGYDYYSSRMHQEAISSFRQFLKQFPQHELADNAQYWIGECYFDLKEYPQAIDEFQMVLDNFPEGNKVADALLKIGIAYAAMGDQENTRIFLLRVISEFRGSEAARKAEERLDRLSR
ncbi:MAG: tol-pal system protein YbgF [Deltaproteobacteria bacterium]|nr:MAG: tol-pal system protein YbgF [Deltaproteobacteria bacterium]